MKLLGLRLKNCLIVLPVYNDTYVKTTIRTYGGKVYTNFCSLNVPEDDIKCEFFTVICIDSSLACRNIYYLQVSLDNCAYKSIDKQMKDYLDDSLFEADED